MTVDDWFVPPDRRQTGLCDQYCAPNQNTLAPARRKLCAEIFTLFVGFQPAAENSGYARPPRREA
jgi:hypothetical protein